MCNSKRCGFTLIEIIIAISIGSLLILVTSASIRTGLSYMQNGEERFDKGLREKVALNFFIQQVTSMRSYNVGNAGNKGNTGNTGIFFIGEKDSVSFISPLSLDKYYTQGLMSCTYTITKDRDDTYSLLYNEKRVLNNDYLTKLMDKFSGELRASSADLLSTGKFFDEEPVIFFQGYQKITLEYLGEVTTGKEEEESPWKESWQINALPKAIKITFLKHGEIQEATAPIMVTS